ncbi:MAG: phosphoribosylanthranilate isomerase [Chlamydiia bacterium]|nr:phosphoribosylanthranilate isomerase [Chlamydiia bacterium]
MPFVKICGVTDPETAHFAASLGARFIGIIFASASERTVDPERACMIAEEAKKGGAQVIGVFVEQDGERMQKIADQVGLDGVQLHGEVARKHHLELSDNLIRLYVCPVSLDGFIQEESHQGFTALDPQRDYLLYDGLTPGSGKAFDWDALEPRRDFNFILAGGLNPQNVRLAIQKKQPDGVDVASGVENPRLKKDRKLIRAFIEEAQ